MARKSDNFPLVLLGGGLGLWLLFHAIWSILFEDWLKHQLEHFVGHTVAEMIERFGAVGFPLLAAMALTWLIYSYAKVHAKAELAGQSGTLPVPESTKLPVFDPSWVRDLSLSDALWRAYSGNWNGRAQLTQPSPEASKFYNAADQIRQHAFEGSLPIWANRPRSNLYEQVPPSFWRNHVILGQFTIGTTASDVFVQVTEALAIGEVPHARTMVWNDFMTSKAAVEKLWPPGDSS